MSGGVSTGRPISVVLAGGGSAGHTSPLIATAQEITRLAPEVRVTAVGTARGLETTVVPAAGLTLELISPVPLPRRPGKDLLLVPTRLGRAVAEAGRLLERVSADVVLGFGGYVSTPVYLAARRRRVPIVIHEQNALPGLANRLAARITDHVFTSFADTPLPHATSIGLPLRSSVTDLDRAGARSGARASFGLPADGQVLLVSGGSQGAATLNRAVSGARDTLLAAGVSVLHAVGPKNLTDDVVAVTDEATGAVYQPLAYIEAMDDAYAAADLMLGRCGASTVLETAAVGLPAVFVPYPHGNGEQARNAAGVVSTGGGMLLADADCTPDWVAAEIPSLIRPDVLAGMSKALAGVGHRDAANVLARETLRAAGWRDGPAAGEEGSH
ncbi:MAG TPA: UDP-N-acetylglucosamine--N-acetylmuramyl-(pentapeptide) pyrophosphoryl-undecaprenol N-acetylglucosamine transferase [Microlunatus sp.]|jgi:UDP-N-acetylglucosamine--N-acetylmuramyl-(pentapeptide) pyrophosphoryl-undecaprenol N-acetylglucosamine transferase|nr:UDP-N-acetylglucosamine--N-acetylmuramyl-(pentapeptide) pyrophosphoryl-undecaprenol N-acetylglucosamine transferase [Microlunatus sp.]